MLERILRNVLLKQNAIDFPVFVNENDIQSEDNYSTENIRKVQKKMKQNNVYRDRSQKQEGKGGPFVGNKQQSDGDFQSPKYGKDISCCVQ